MTQRISGIKYTTEEMDTPVKQTVKLKFPDTNIQEIWDAVKIQDLRITKGRGIIEEGEETKSKVPENILNKIMEENSSNLKRRYL